MLRRHFRWGFSFLVIVVLCGLGRPANAQRERRWLADPTLLVPAKVVGPNGGIVVANGIAELDLLDAQTGFAVDGWGLLRFDGRFWRPYRNFGARVGLRAIDLVAPNDGWVAGSQFVDGGPPSVHLARFNGQDWTTARVESTDPANPYYFAGSLADISAHPNGTAWAVGMAWTTKTPPATGYSERPLILFFDGTSWQERTPSAWRAGQLNMLSMISATEGWITGTIGTGDGGLRPLIAQLKDGVWTEEALPMLSSGAQLSTIRGITMDANGEGWAFSSVADEHCPSSTLLRRSGGTWTALPSESHNGRAITALGLVPGTNRGWATLDRCDRNKIKFPAQRMRFDNGAFAFDGTGAALAPHTYGILNENIQWAVAGGAIMRFSNEALPTARVAGSGAGGRYFAPTGHTISEPFRSYYETHGLNLGDSGISERESLALFGYPLSEPFTEINPDTGELLQVQYFERARFEYHPNNPDPHKVLLGRLGAYRLLTAGGNTAMVGRNPDPSAPAPGCTRYGETGYSLCPPFHAFWNANGGLPVFGFPILQAREEINPTDGMTYPTQWFERERLEYHAELQGTPYEVLLGLLAAEDLRQRGYLPAE